MQICLLSIFHILKYHSYIILSGLLPISVKSVMLHWKTSSFHVAIKFHYSNEFFCENLCTIFIKKLFIFLLYLYKKNISFKNTLLIDIKNIQFVFQLTFDTFTVGRFDGLGADGCPDGYMAVAEQGRPESGGRWCGAAWGYTVYYSETPSVNVTLRLDRLAQQVDLCI